AFMLRYAGDRFDRAEWRDAGEVLAAEVYRLYQQDETFPEYNSPTYYGVNLGALALWRSYSASEAIRRMGEEMEAGLWRDIARFYHAGMRNLCGPYDRSYGMDMRRYAAITGLWIWGAVGEERAPFPNWRQDFEHTNDFCFAPTVALLGVRVPPDVMPHLMEFQGSRQVERVIVSSPRRVATAHITERLMIGAEDANGTKRPSYQYHPATAHWLAPDGEVGWIRLIHQIPVDARVDGNKLEVWTSDSVAMTATVGADEEQPEVVFQLSRHTTIAPEEWILPGLSVRIQTNARAEVIPGSAGTEMEVRYRCPPGEVARFVLWLRGT
ncbi:MAG TPA: hypothetical protein VGW38_20785, partial [Chloroflexota bacterium]|nr:hypothetical protein [Chloroflexota bacterium]